MHRSYFRFHLRISYTLVNCRNFSALPPSLMSLALLIRDWTASLREDFRNSLSIPINDCEAQITRVLESHATNYSTRISSIDGSYRIEASFVPISTTAIRSRIIRSPFNPIQPHLSHRIHRFLDRLDDSGYPFAGIPALFLSGGEGEQLEAAKSDASVPCV